MKRELVLKKLRAVQSEIAEIKKIDFKTSCGGVFVPGVGMLCEANTLQGLIKFHAAISHAKAALEKSAKELQIELTDEEFEYNGVQFSTWMKDIKTIKEEIIANERLGKLVEAEKVLQKHLSDDDIFTIDMEEISDTLDSVK